MLYSFKVVDTPSHAIGPGPDYFRCLVAEAQKAASTENLGYQEALAVSEYLDAVDAGALKMDKRLYRTCLRVLGEYLDGCDQEEATRLSARSWAAKTVLEVLCQMDNGKGAQVLVT